MCAEASKEEASGNDEASGIEASGALSVLCQVVHLMMAPHAPAAPLEAPPWLPLLPPANLKSRSGPLEEPHHASSHSTQGEAFETTPEAPEESYLLA